MRDPLTGESYTRDPRYIAQKAEAYLKSTGLADTVYFGPEAEFYIFDSVRFDQNQYSGYYFLDSVEGVWNSGRERELDGSPNLGVQAALQGGLLPRPADGPVPGPALRDGPVNSKRSASRSKCNTTRSAPQARPRSTCASTRLPRMADKLMLYKYVVKNVARARGNSVTFMPKPLFQDNGSGMHVHQSLWKDGQPLFFDEKGYAGLSDMARWYIGGLLKHAPAILAFSNPTTNSYKRLVPGLRGAGQPRVLAAQPFRVGADPAVLEEPEGQAPRVPLPRPVVQPVPRVLGDAHGGPRRDPEPHRAARTRSTATSTTCRPKSWRRFPRCPGRSTRRSPRSRPTTSSC